MEHAQDILTRDEAAAYLKVCISTLNNLKRNGLIRHLRIGRVVRYRREWLDAFINEQSLR